MGVQVLVKKEDVIKAGGTITTRVIYEGFWDNENVMEEPVRVPPFAVAVIQFGINHLNMIESGNGCRELWCDAKYYDNPVYALLDSNNVPYRRV